MQAKRGKMFVFEGANGCGKTTFANQLTALLQEKGIDAACFSFPGRSEGTLGNVVYRIHHAPEVFGLNQMSPFSKQLLHIAAHVDAIETSILPALEKGCHVLMDRFWWSTLVYGEVDGLNKQLLDQAIAVERTVWGDIEPSAIFLMTRARPIDEPFTEKWKLIQSNYLALAGTLRSACSIEIIKNEQSLQVGLDRTLESILTIL